MFPLVSILSLVAFHFVKVSSECESNAMLWTYYPCSFIISPTTFYCQHVSINSSINQCINRDVTFFWHFPLGNMTLTLQSDKNQSFLLHLSQIALTANKLIRNIYHLINSKTSEERLIYNADNGNEMITISSDKHYQCSLRFETINSNIFDYGTFIRMTILTTERKNR